MRSICVVLAAAALCACGGNKGKTVNVQAEGEAIRALDAAWVKAIADKDLGKTVGMYSADAVFLAPNEPIKSGAELKNSWDGMLKMTNVALSFAPTSINVDDAGTMAYDVGSYQFAFDDPKAGHVQDHGKYLVVWRKQGTEWKVVADSFNSDVPMTPPASNAAAPSPESPKPAAPSPAPEKK